MKILLSVFLLALTLFPTGVFAQELDLEPIAIQAPTSFETTGTITSFQESFSENGVYRYEFEAMDSDGNTFSVDSNDSYLEGLRYPLSEGQRVRLQVVDAIDGSQTVFLVDVIRTGRLFLLIGLFAVVAVVVGYLRGALALVGLAITIAILFGYILPSIVGGSNPLTVTILGSIVILAINIHLTHGFSKQIFGAFVSTALGLGIVVILAQSFTAIAKLSGLATEEAALFYLHTGQSIDPRGLLLAGIILGAVGVLDDIAVTQTETVAQLAASNPSLSKKELFTRAMHVGRHHIASVINTLVLAYAGVALPLFLVFFLSPDLTPLLFLNEELVSEELVRTLAGTLGLMLLVPLSTWMATQTGSVDKPHTH